jgi:hypothetical protein
MKKNFLIILLFFIQQTEAQVCFTSTNYPVNNSSTTIACADFNNDGKLDLVVAHYGFGEIYMLPGNGLGGFGTSTIAYNSSGPGSSVKYMVSGDFNIDGKADLAITDGSSSGIIKILYGNGAGGFPSTASFAVASYPSSILSADFNGDNKIDLATANDGSISVLLGNGAGSFNTHVDFLTEAGLNAIACGDFNGDGKVDLTATANNNGGGPDSVSVLLNNGAGSFGTATKYLAGSGPYSVCSKDFNGDGFSDLAVANTNSNDVSVLLSKGASGAFFAATNFAAGSVPFSVVSEDFNSDGKPDLAIGDHSNSSAVLLGNGTGSFGAASNFSTVSGPWKIISADFNGDGKPDLATANQSSNNVSVLLNVVVTNCIGCALNAGPQIPTICMVSTDSASNYDYNIVTWEKSLYSNVDSFIVYRKDAITSNYLRIGAVSNDSLSVFTDTAFSIGGPNGGNSKYSSWFYKLAIRDSCGNIGTKGPYHQTMFVQGNGSNFSWNAYTVETGQTNPVTGYSFLRDDNNTGNWHVLVNTIGLTTTDPNYTSYPNGNWRIDALGFNCTPTRTQSILKSHSNTIKQAVTGIKHLTLNDEQITIYPNPTTGNFIIGTSVAEKQSIQVFDLNGKLVFSQNISGKTTIDATSLCEGVYNIVIKTVNTNNVVNKKLVIIK